MKIDSSSTDDDSQLLIDNSGNSSDKNVRMGEAVQPNRFHRPRKGNQSHSIRFVDPRNSLIVHHFLVSRFNFHQPGDVRASGKHGDGAAGFRYHRLLQRSAADHDDLFSASHRNAG